MWTFKRHFRLKNTRQNSFVSSLYSRDSDVYVGTSDGKVVTERYDFQSHERGFDYLESNEISEKINSIAAFSSGTFHENLVTCNEKSIKLWRIRPDLGTEEVLEKGHGCPGGSTDQQPEESAAAGYRFECIKNLKNVHSYCINSLSVSKNEHLLISADYLRIYLWCTQNMENCFNLVDTKPSRCEELEFVITKCLFKDSSVFGYGTTHGMVYVNDLRISPQSMRINSVTASKVSFYDDLVRAVSDFKFFGDEYLVTRDLNSLTMYDLRNTRSELRRYTLFETQESFLENMLRRDTESDSFSMGLWGSKVVTGGYDSKVYLVSLDSGEIDTICLEAEDPMECAIEHCVMGSSGFVCSHKDGCYVYTRDA